MTPKMMAVITPSSEMHMSPKSMTTRTPSSRTARALRTMLKAMKPNEVSSKPNRARWRIDSRKEIQAKLPS